MDEPALGPDEEARIRSQIATLREERQDLDDAVRALEGLRRPDQLQIARNLVESAGLNYITEPYIVDATR